MRYINKATSVTNDFPPLPDKGANTINQWDIDKLKYKKTNPLPFYKNEAQIAIMVKEF